MPEYAPSDDATALLDDLLMLQLTVAIAGEDCDGERLAWWRTSMTDPDMGLDLLEQLCPRTARWASLEAAREAARCADARLRARTANPDALLTLFHLGSELDEALDHRFAAHKAAGAPPEEALPALADHLDGDTDTFRAWVDEHERPTTRTMPVGRRLVHPAGDDRPALARQLVGALGPVAPGSDYPLPYAERP